MGTERGMLCKRCVGVAGEKLERERVKEEERVRTKNGE